MLNRDYTFVLKNKEIVSIDSKNIDITITPNINLDGYLINPNYYFNLDIRAIISLAMNSEIESEHLNKVNPEKDNLEELKIPHEIVLKTNIDKITKDYVSEVFNNREFKIHINAYNFMKVFKHSQQLEKNL